MSKSFSSAVLAVWSVLLWLFMGQLYVSAQFLPADASMRVTRVDQNLNPISGTQAQIFWVERDASGVIGIRRIYSPLYSTNPTVFTTDLQTIFNELYALGKPYTGLSLSVTDLPYHNEYLGSCVGENCIPTFSPYRMTLTSRGFCNGTVCTEAEHLGFGGNWFIKYVPGPDVCPAGKHPFPDVTSVPCVLRSTMKLWGGTELKLESTPNIIGSCSLKTTYQQNGSSYTVTPASGSALSVSSPGMSILANVTANIPVGQDSLPNILNCPTDYVAMCSISDTGSNLCGCYFPHLPGETWAPIKPSNYTCVDDVVSTCGNPRAQVNFVPYTGIPVADQNSSTNAWDSITLGNKAVISGGTFFDITDGINPIDDGTIVTTGLQNFAVSRHNGYIEFLALGRRLTTYYGYYQGTIKFQNVQVDRVEWGLTTATWADIGLEAAEGDTVTKVSDTEVSFKLAFANQGDGFRVYLKNPAPTACTCPAGQEKKPDPKSPVCIVRALVKGVQDTEFILTGYNHLVGNCILAAGTPQAPQTPSTQITVTAGQQRTSWMQWSPWTFQLDPLLTCPAGTTKTACMFTYGVGPLGEITCGCYPNENTNTPKNLSCRTFTDPLINGRPVFARNASPAQFCREQWYSQSATVGTEYDYLGNGSLWNGSVWEVNNHLAAIKDVSCCKLEDKPNDICVASGCAEGQYWCQSENMCKTAGQTCNTLTCNNNNTCETGESCNCADCTNGGTDDKDKCGFASTGAQMVCTKDVKNTTTSTSPLPTTEKWVAYMGPYHIYIAKIPADAHTLSGKTFYIYDPEKIIPLASMSKTAFLANPTEAIKNAPTIPIGTTALASRNIFNLAQLQSESQIIQDTTIQNITSTIYYRYLCRESKAGSTNCSYNNEPVFSPGTWTALWGDIYSPVTGNDSYITYGKAEILGTFDVVSAPSVSTQNIALSGTSGNNNWLFQKIATLSPGEYSISGSGTSYNDGGGGTNMVFFSKKNIPDGWMPPAGWGDGIDFAKYGAATGQCPEVVYYQWSQDLNIIYAVKRWGCGSMPWTIPSGTKIIAQDTTYVYRVMVQSAVAGNIRIDKLPTPITAPVWACCPAGSQWDSSQGKCALEAVPGCAEGEYYCHAELKCKAAGASCGTVTCNNNNVCDTNESCDCADCTNGGTDDKDQCGLTSTGAQMVCTKDIDNAVLIPDIPYSKTITLSGNSWNNVGYSQKVLTLEPGTYTFSGSGNSYNSGGWGTNTLFFSQNDYANYTQIQENLSPYQATTTGACPEIISYYHPTNHPVIIYGIKRCGLETPKWTIPANTTLTFTKQTHLYLLLTQAAADGTVTITGLQKAPSVVPDVNNYTTEADGSRIYTNPKKNSRPLSAVQNGYTSVWGAYDYTADSASLFCREQGFYQAVVLDQETTTETLTQWDSTANIWSTAPGAATGGTSTKNVWPTPVGTRVKSLKCAVTSSAQWIRVYTDTIPRFIGRFTGTYDDYRNTDRNGIDAVCATAGLHVFNDAQIDGVNYKCNTGAAPTRHFHNGAPSDNNGGGGSGWCASTSVEWVLCKPKDITITPPPQPIQVGACCPAGLKWSSVQNKCVWETCAQWQYFCLSENVCKPSGQACTVTTCNNNNTCEAGESCNCADCTNGGSDDVDKCGLSNNVQMVCTKDINNTTTAGVFSSITAQENFNIVNNKLATVLSQQGNANISAGEFGTAATELKMTQYDWKDTAGNFIFFTSFTQAEAWAKVKELLSIPASAQVLWSQKSVKYENDSIWDNERYLYSYVIQQTAGVQKQIFFATEYLPSLSLGWRKVYLISKDYPLSTVPTGSEVCQNFVNPILFWKPLALWTPSVGSSWIVPFCLEQWFRGTSTVVDTSFLTGWLTLWKSNGTGWEPNQNGDKINEIRCCGIPSNATTGTIQVWACCPVGTQWSSTASACVTDKCGERQYYCHEELKCKPANQPCQAVVCEDKVVFNYTGAIQNYTVPADVSKIQIKAWGAAGGSGATPWIYIGAAGWYSQGDIGVTGGEQFKIVVGEGGKRASTLMTFGGGGAGTPGWGGSGGGLSGIFRNSFTHTNSLLIAGGGSGASGGGNQNSEWFGGGLQGGYRTTDGYGGQHPMPGTQTAGGVSVAPYSTSLKGGDGGPLAGGNWSMTYCYDGGAGGGGGGYYGGSGGVGDWCTFPSAGDTEWAGGSGYLHSTLANASFITATVADPKTAPKKTDADYVAGVAEGKNTGDGSGGNGLVVITECRPKPVATCNNNGTCDTNESCNCADCNDKADHCAINGTGEQLICTKDTTPPCFTDKFPYCFPACLDGYTRNASGQCVPASTITNSVASSAPLTCTIRRVNNNSLANIASCNAGEKRVWGGCGNTGGWAYRYASFPIAKNGTYTASNGSILTALQDGWICDSGSTGTNVEASAVCCTGGDLDGTYTIRKESDAYVVSTVECQAGEKRIGGGCRNVGGSSVNYGSFPIVGGQNYQDGARYTIPAPTNDGWLCDPGSTGQVTEAFAICLAPAPGKNPIITIQKGPDTSSPAFGICPAWANLLWGGCRNTAWGGYHFWGVPMYTGDVWASRSFTAPGNGFACNDGSTGTSVESYALCLSVPTSSAPPSTYSSEPQLWACCPPGSAWNSVENRCIPTTCGEGQFYCAAQKKCLAGGQTCDTAVCNNDGVCSGEESCQCGDCVNGWSDDQDKCGMVNGKQAVCSDDNLNDGKPGACCVAPKKWNTATSSCVECSNTQAPSELKAGIDQPYITCTGNGDTTKTHFKYRITKQGSTDAPFISEIFTIGTPVLHPTMTLGDYTVECFYGNATGVDTSTTATPHSCVKTMSVKSDAQGCSRVYPYKESTLSDEMISASAFDASFRCGSRKPVVGAITNPYMFRVGTQAPAYLSFDALISELFNGLTIGPVSTQTQNYNFDTGNTDVTCATKVGGGYSTNTACQLRTCVGGACNVPQTFSVVHSDDLICTTEETSTYNIGCNPAAPDGVRNQCIQWFRDAVNAGSRNVANGVEFNVSFVFNADVPTNVTCIKYVAGQMPGGLNLSDNVVCRATLKNGEKYQIYAADTNGRIDALQTTAKTVERDREAPTMAEIKYYTDETLTTEISSTQWYNKPVIALAVCSDTPLNEATSCACAQRVDTTTTDADSWSLGVPNSLIGADLMRYTRTITETLTGTQKVQVMDTAGNTSTAKNIAVSLDTQAPLVTPTESGTGATRTITLTASDTGSKIWKTTGAPSGATNTSGIIYRVGPKADMATLAFDTACNTTATYATVTETQSSSYPSQATATISNLNTATQVVAYCVRDNAGNTTRGMYPVTADACFSATNMSTIPNFDTYKWLLKTRLTTIGNDNQKYGYSFSENTADASCFRGILSTNITTLMTNQLKPRTSTTLSNWDRDRAELSTSTTLSNGYYYYVYPTSNTLNIVASPSGGAPVKSVVVEWGDIRIKTDINYSGAGKTLLLIARKNSNGQGGNIIIDTSVKNIDAILIADGGSLRSSDATLPGERLTINGRLYSYNTRGGSLTVSGTDFIDAATPKKFTNSSLVNASSLNDARIQDLERFRPIFADGNNTCSLTVNYTAFTTANIPALLKRPSTYTGGSCGF